jgi:hypothetical protein
MKAERPQPAIRCDAQIDRQHGAIRARLQAARARRQGVRQHRHHAIGKIDAVAAFEGGMVGGGTGADIMADVGNGDDQPVAFAIRPGPDRVVMVARVLGVDGEDRKMGPVFPRAEILRCGGIGRLQHIVAEMIGDIFGGDCNAAQRAGGERVAQPLDDMGRRARAAAAHFGKQQFAGVERRGAVVARACDRPVALLPAVDRTQPEAAMTVGRRHAQHRGRRCPQPLDDGGAEAAVGILGDAGKNPVSGLESDRASAARHRRHADEGRRQVVGLPRFGIAFGTARTRPRDLDDANPRRGAGPAQRTAGARIQQAVVDHVGKQRLQRGAFIAVDAEMARNLAPAGIGRRGRQKGENRLPVGQRHQPALAGAGFARLAADFGAALGRAFALSAPRAGFLGAFSAAALGAALRAGALRRADGFAAFSASSAIAASSVSASGAAPRGRVALVVPSVT